VVGRSTTTRTAPRFEFWVFLSLCCRAGVRAVESPTANQALFRWLPRNCQCLVGTTENSAGRNGCKRPAGGGRGECDCPCSRDYTCVSCFTGRCLQVTSAKGGYGTLNFFWPPSFNWKVCAGGDNDNGPHTASTRVSTATRGPPGGASRAHRPVKGGSNHSGAVGARPPYPATDGGARRGRTG
jgi:hypothetical protein